VSAEDCMMNEGDDIEYNYNSLKRNMDRYLALKKATKDADEKVKQPGYFGEEEE